MLGNGEAFCLVIKGNGRKPGWRLGQSQIAMVLKSKLRNLEMLKEPRNHQEF